MSVVALSLLGMSDSPNGKVLPPSRAKKDAVAEIVAMSILAMLIAFIVAAFPYGEGSVGRILRLAPTAGRAVMEHIGWAFGVYIPILLSFYAIVIGGQLSADLPSAFRGRRTLGIVAEAMTGALVPALVLIAVACAADTSHAGALLVIAPASAVTFFLALQLGEFIVFERALRLASAERSRDWAKQRLDTLRARSRKPLWLVVAVHALVGAVIGTATTLILAGSTRPIAFIFLVCGLVALGLGALSVFGVYHFCTARDRTSEVLAWIIPAVLYILVIVFALRLIAEVALPVGVGLLAVVIFSSVSTFWHRKRAPRYLVDWTLQGGAVGYAAKAVSSTYVRSVREVRELSPTAVTEESLTLRGKFTAALLLFRRALPIRTS